MAGNDAVVTVEDDATVTVDVSDLGLGAEDGADQLADNGKDKDVDVTVTGAEEAGADRAAQVAADKADKAARRTRTPAAVDEAAKALTEAQTATASALATAEAERAQRLAAEQRVAQREQEVVALRDQTIDQQLTIIETNITRVTNEMSAARAELRAAHEEGNFDKIADVQVKMATLGGELAAERGKKTAHEEAKKRGPAPAAATEGRVVAAPSQNVAFDRYVSSYTPKAQAWLRAHPDCAPAEVGGNAVKNAAMMEGHWAARRQNIAEGSDDYYRVIEEHAGYRQPAVSLASETRKAGEGGGVDQRQQVPRQRAAAPSAPPSRDGAESGAAVTQRTLKLNTDQMDAALFSYPAKQGESEADHRKRAFGTYAREYVKAQAEGKIGRMSH